MNGLGQKSLSPHTRQVNMSQAWYSLHEHCILKTLCMGHWQKGVPLSKTNSMIIYFDSHTTNTSDIMFK